MELQGIDVSKYQGTIDWGKVSSSGIKFAFVRAGWAGYAGEIDEGWDGCFERSMEGAIAAGIPVGVYVYSYCRTPQAARAYVEKLVPKLRAYHITWPIAIDIEDAATYKGLGRSANSAIVSAWCNAVREAGYTPLLYTYTSFAQSYLDMATLANYDLWLADYRGHMGIAGASIWQYSSSGSVPGIAGRVDLNTAYKDFAAGTAGAGSDDMQFYSVFGEKNCQCFGAQNVNDVIGTLTSGVNYPVLSDIGTAGGYHWVRLYVAGMPRWAVVLDDRARLLSAGQFTPEEIAKTISDQAPPCDTAELKNVQARLAAANSTISAVRMALGV